MTFFDNDTGTSQTKSSTRENLTSAKNKVTGGGYVFLSLRSLAQLQRREVSGAYSNTEVSTSHELRALVDRPAVRVR